MFTRKRLIVVVFSVLNEVSHFVCSQCNYLSIKRDVVGCNVTQCARVSGRLIAFPSAFRLPTQCVGGEGGVCWCG